MNESLEVKEAVGCSLMRNRILGDILNPQGFFGVELFRNGQKILDQICPNTVTTAGKNSWLDVFFRAQTQLANWYIGLVDNSGWSAFDVADTMSSHTGWVEFHTGYSQSTRVAWTQSAASAASITNGTAATFDITATATLKGIFVTSISTKGGTTGTLWTGAAFASTVAVANGDQLKITYTVNS